MKSSLVAIVLIMLSMSSSASEIVCSVDQLLNGVSKEIPVSTRKNSEVFDAMINGSEPPKGPIGVGSEKPVEIDGHYFSVYWFAGNEFEGQTLLRMKVDNIMSSMYDVRKEGQVGVINNIELGDKLRFQCVFN